MGKLVVLDGLDGSGKSTQLDRLDEYLSHRGIPYKRISFPDYAQPSSALVQQYLAGDFGSDPTDVNVYAVSSFYAVDRYASYKRFWETNYADGELILAARYTTSNAIYQMAKLPREEWDGYLRWLADYEYGKLGLPRPDRVLFLDMPLEVSQRLLSERYAGDERQKDIHERDLAFLGRCREAALYAAARDGWTVLPCGEGDCPLPRETVTHTLIDQLERLGHD